VVAISDSDSKLASQTRLFIDPKLKALEGWISLKTALVKCIDPPTQNPFFPWNSTWWILLAFQYWAKMSHSQKGLLSWHPF
jgi:hypothetical protein